MRKFNNIPSKVHQRPGYRFSVTVVNDKKSSLTATETKVSGQIIISPESRVFDNVTVAPAPSFEHKKLKRTDRFDLMENLDPVDAGTTQEIMDLKRPSEIIQHWKENMNDYSMVSLSTAVQKIVQHGMDKAIHKREILPAEDVQRIAAHTVGKLREAITFQHKVNRWRAAAATEGKQDPEIQSELASTPDITLFPRTIASTALALAKMNKLPPTLVEEMANLLLTDKKLMHKMDHRDVAMFAQACNMTNVRVPQVFNQMVDKVLERPEIVHPKNITSITLSYANMGIYAPDLFMDFGTRLESLVDQPDLFNAQSVANAVLSFTKAVELDTMSLNETVRDRYPAHFSHSSAAASLLSSLKNRIERTCLDKRVPIEEGAFTAQGLSSVALSYARPLSRLYEPPKRVMALEQKGNAHFIDVLGKVNRASELKEIPDNLIDQIIQDELTISLFGVDFRGGEETFLRPEVQKVLKKKGVSIPEAAAFSKIPIMDYIRVIRAACVAMVHPQTIRTANSIQLSTMAESIEIAHTILSTQRAMLRISYDAARRRLKEEIIRDRNKVRPPVESVELSANTEQSVTSSEGNDVVSKSVPLSSDSLGTGRLRRLIPRLFRQLRLVETQLEWLRAQSHISDLSKQSVMIMSPESISRDFAEHAAAAKEDTYLENVRAETHEAAVDALIPVDNTLRTVLEQGTNLYGQKDPHVTPNVVALEAEISLLEDDFAAARRMLRAMHADAPVSGISRDSRSKILQNRRKARELGKDHVVEIVNGIEVTTFLDEDDKEMKRQSKSAIKELKKVVKNWSNPKEVISNTPEDHNGVMDAVRAREGSERRKWEDERDFEALRAQRVSESEERIQTALEKEIGAPVQDTIRRFGIAGRRQAMLQRRLQRLDQEEKELLEKIEVQNNELSSSVIVDDIDNNNDVNVDNSADADAVRDLETEEKEEEIKFPSQVDTPSEVSESTSAAAAHLQALQEERVRTQQQHQLVSQETAAASEEISRLSADFHVVHTDSFSAESVVSTTPFSPARRSPLYDAAGSIPVADGLDAVESIVSADATAFPELSEPVLTDTHLSRSEEELHLTQEEDLELSLLQQDRAKIAERVREEEAYVIATEGITAPLLAIDPDDSMMPSPGAVSGSEDVSLEGSVDAEVDAWMDEVEDLDLEEGFPEIMNNPDFIDKDVEHKKKALKRMQRAALEAQGGFRRGRLVRPVVQEKIVDGKIMLYSIEDGVEVLRDPQEDPNGDPESVAPQLQGEFAADAAALAELNRGRVFDYKKGLERTLDGKIIPEELSAEFHAERDRKRELSKKPSDGGLHDDYDPYDLSQKQSETVGMDRELDNVLGFATAHKLRGEKYSPLHQQHAAAIAMPFSLHDIAVLASAVAKTGTIAPTLWARIADRLELSSELITSLENDWDEEMDSSQTNKGESVDSTPSSTSLSRRERLEQINEASTLEEIEAALGPEHTSGAILAGIERQRVRHGIEDLLRDMTPRDVSDLIRAAVLAAPAGSLSRIVQAVALTFADEDSRLVLQMRRVLLQSEKEKEKAAREKEVLEKVVQMKKAEKLLPSADDFNSTVSEDAQPEINAGLTLEERRKHIENLRQERLQRRAEKKSLRARLAKSMPVESDSDIILPSSGEGAPALSEREEMIQDAIEHSVDEYEYNRDMAETYRDELALESTSSDSQREMEIFREVNSEMYVLKTPKGLRYLTAAEMEAENIPIPSETRRWMKSRPVSITNELTFNTHAPLMTVRGGLRPHLLKRLEKLHVPIPESLKLGLPAMTPVVTVPISEEERTVPRDYKVLDGSGERETLRILRERALKRLHQQDPSHISNTDDESTNASGTNSNELTLHKIHHTTPTVLEEDAKLKGQLLSAGVPLVGLDEEVPTPSFDEEPTWGLLERLHAVKSRFYARAHQRPVYRPRGDTATSELVVTHGEEDPTIGYRGNFVQALYDGTKGSFAGRLMYKQPAHSLHALSVALSMLFPFSSNPIVAHAEQLSGFTLSRDIKNQFRKSTGGNTTEQASESKSEGTDDLTAILMNYNRVNATNPVALPPHSTAAPLLMKLPPTSPYLNHPSLVEHARRSVLTSLEIEPFLLLPERAEKLPFFKEHRWLHGVPSFHTRGIKRAAANSLLDGHMATLYLLRSINGRIPDRLAEVTAETAASTLLASVTRDYSVRAKSLLSPAQLHALRLVSENLSQEYSRKLLEQKEFRSLAEASFAHALIPPRQRLAHVAFMIANNRAPVFHELAAGVAGSIVAQLEKNPFAIVKAASNGESLLQSSDTSFFEANMSDGSVDAKKQNKVKQWLLPSHTGSGAAPAAAAMRECVQAIACTVDAVLHLNKGNLTHCMIQNRELFGAVKYLVFQGYIAKSLVYLGSEGSVKNPNDPNFERIKNILNPSAKNSKNGQDLRRIQPRTRVSLTSAEIRHLLSLVVSVGRLSASITIPPVVHKQPLPLSLLRLGLTDVTYPESDKKLLYFMEKNISEKTRAPPLLDTRIVYELYDKHIERMMAKAKTMADLNNRHDNSDILSSFRPNSNSEEVDQMELASDERVWHGSSSRRSSKQSKSPSNAALETTHILRTLLPKYRLESSNNLPSNDILAPKTPISPLLSVHRAIHVVTPGEKPSVEEQYATAAVVASASMVDQVSPNLALKTLQGRLAQDGRLQNVVALKDDVLNVQFMLMAQKLLQKEMLEKEKRDSLLSMINKKLQSPFWIHGFRVKNSEKEKKDSTK